MAGLFGKLFPALFSNPEEEAFRRKMRIGSALRRFNQEVKKQDGFIKQYLQQAMNAKRTGDSENYDQIKKAISFTFACRTRVQRSQHALQLVSTMANQMEAYRDFCGAVNDISESMSNAISLKDVVNAQENLARAMKVGKSTEEMMDQLLSSFDASFAEYVTGENESEGMKGVDLDSLIAQMAAAHDNLTEERISQILNGKGS